MINCYILTEDWIKLAGIEMTTVKQTKKANNVKLFMISSNSQIFLIWLKWLYEKCLLLDTSTTISVWAGKAKRMEWCYMSGKLSFYTYKHSAINLFSQWLAVLQTLLITQMASIANHNVKIDIQNIPTN